MNEQQLQEWEKKQQTKQARPKMRAGRFGVLRFDPPQSSSSNGQPQPQRVTQRAKRRTPSQDTHTRVHRKQEQVERKEHQDARIQHEMQEMRETHDLRDVDDDVEDVATLYEWRAHEHNHQPKSQRWFILLAAALTITVVGLVLLGNVIGAITIAFAGGFVYWIAQREPNVIRYRVLTEGIAFNNTLYHYQDLEAFNIVYEPGFVKTVILRSKRTFSPLLHMEIGDADPVAIRDILLEFVVEDQELHEPLVDIYARRLGF